MFEFLSELNQPSRVHVLHRLALISSLTLIPLAGFAEDSVIHGVDVGTPVPVTDNNGDTWAPAWARDGSIYSPSNDTNGFAGKGSGNIVFNHIVGDSPDKLTGETVNYMGPDYGKANQEWPDGCTWKSSGCLALDGALYWLVARHRYGGQQTAQNASIIISRDSGKTWTRSEKDNLEHPLFPGSDFATPYFVDYGQEGKEAVADRSDRYVYALSNNGFWDNGDKMILGRVLRSKLPDLSGADWQYFIGGNGADDTAWSSKVGEATAVVTAPNHLGMTGATYLPAQKCYVMIGWYYPDGGGKKTPDACKMTRWDFYVASHPWGPWQVVGSHTWNPQGFYTPQICPKFTSTDGTVIWAFTAGNWNDGNSYKLTLVPLTLKL